jgi:hypothetical protein
VGIELACSIRFVQRVFRLIYQRGGHGDCRDAFLGLPAQKLGIAFCDRWLLKSLREFGRWCIKAYEETPLHLLGAKCDGRSMTRSYVACWCDSSSAS